jgi:hypothetical protein
MLTIDSHIHQDLHFYHEKHSDRHCVFENRLHHNIPFASENHNDEDYLGTYDQVATYPEHHHGDSDAIVHHSTTALVPGPTGYLPTDYYSSASWFTLETRRDSGRRS